MRESKSVSDAYLTSKCVRLSSIICDDTVALQFIRTIHIKGPILKWKSTKLGMILLKFRLLGLAKHSQAGSRHGQAQLSSKSIANFEKKLQVSFPGPAH